MKEAADILKSLERIEHLLKTVAELLIEQKSIQDRCADIASQSYRRRRFRNVA